MRNHTENVRLKLTDENDTWRSKQETKQHVDIHSDIIRKKLTFFGTSKEWSTTESQNKFLNSMKPSTYRHNEDEMDQWNQKQPKTGKNCTKIYKKQEYLQIKNLQASSSPRQKTEEKDWNNLVWRKKRSVHQNNKEIWAQRKAEHINIHT